MAVTNSLHPHIVASLIAAGADVNATIATMDHTAGTLSGETALHAAASHGDRKGHIPLLLAASASVDAMSSQGKRQTPLEYAIHQHIYHTKFLRRAYPHLLRAGARIPLPRYREIPYIDKVVAAGGYVRYERAHRASLAAIFVPKFPQLPEEVVPVVVGFLGTHWVLLSR